MKKKGKKFNAVKMMRDIRNELSERYSEHPEIEDKELSLIRTKYRMPDRLKT